MARRTVTRVAAVLATSVGVLAAAFVGVLPASADISGQSATNDNDWVYYSFRYTGAPSFVRVYLDTDRDATTGLATAGVGADYLLEGGSLFRHAGDGWTWATANTVTYSASDGTAQWAVARADIGETATPGDADLVFQTDPPLDTSQKLTQRYQSVVTYVPSYAVISNPERGFYRHTGDCDKSAFDAATLGGYRTDEQVSLVMCVFYLTEFRNSPISAAALALLQQQADTVRAAGMKMILRFAYTDATTGEDAPPARVLEHIDQLSPYLRGNGDVIYVLQAGFVGAWGEWWYTRNFGDAGVVSTTDWDNRRAITDRLLAALPAGRMIQVRTPKIKRLMYGPSALPPGQAYGATPASRIGHHNDCFLASSTDSSTYEDPAVEYPYLAAETRYLVMGGETCIPNPPRTQCPTALEELTLFHYSYLNVGYRAEVLDGWQAEGCLTEIHRRLGYRFVLTRGSYATTAATGATLRVAFEIRNDGFAALVNPRTVDLILRHTETGATFARPLATDPRRWAPGTTTSVDNDVVLQNVPPGTYELLLNLPDPDPDLAHRPEYSIALANATVWEASTGLNNLHQTVTIE